MESVSPDVTRIAPVHEEVIRAIEPEVERNLRVLPAIEVAWQPADYLPDLEGEGWHEQVSALREASRAIPDDLLVVLVGDMVTEEALPSYSMAFNHVAQDREGTSPAPWARWLRGWTAEENRHGDLLNAYLRLSGRVNMRAIEQTVHALLSNGFDSGSQDDGYNVLVYTSFQERATRVSHGNVGRLAEKAGDATLARICRTIAGDEARHETFYTRMMSAVLDVDPEGGIHAFAGMIDRQITMPGRLMADGKDPDLFDHFSVVAQRVGVYTAMDYAAIIEHLVDAWDIGKRKVSGEAARAQENLCRAAARYRRLATRVTSSLSKQPPVGFSWIYDRQV